MKKRKSVFLCSVQRWRSACRLALGHRAAALAVEQAEREAVLQVRVPVEIQLVVLLEGEVQLMPIAEFESLQPQHRSSV